jgi:branched-chain amino acid transport system substrate-binding protein
MRYPIALMLALVLGSASAFAQPKPANLAPYKIGLTYPLTGPFATNAQTYLPAIDLAVADVNKKGGVNGHPIEMIAEDTQATPAGGVEAMRKVVQVQGVQAVMTIYTNVVTAQIPLADQLRVPAISPAETPGLLDKAQFSFAHSARLADELAFLGRWWKKNNYKRIYAFWSNNAQGAISSPAARSTVEGIGGTYGDALVNLTDTDFRGIGARAKDFKADMVLVNLQGALVETTLIKQLREVGVEAPIVETAVFYNSKYWRDGVGPYSEGMYFAGINIDPAAGKDLIHFYHQKTGYDPDYVCGEVWDMVHILAATIGKVGYDGPKIRDALANLKDFPTVFGGTVSMQDDHRTKFHKLGFYQVRHGKLVEITSEGQ